MEENINNKEEIDAKVLEFKRALEEKINAEYEEGKLNISEEENSEEIQKPQISSIKYYTEFSLKTKIKEDLKLADVYIVQLKTGDITTYEIYSKDTEHKIAEIDISEKIKYINELIDDEISIEELEEMNIESKTEYTIEELEQLEEEHKIDEKEKEDLEENLEEGNPEQEQEELLEDTEHNTEVLEEELGLDKGDIASCTRVILTGKENLFLKAVPEAKEFDRVNLVYVKSEDSFKFVGLRAGQPPRYLDSVEGSKGTMKQSINIDAENGNMEVQNIKGLMKVKDNDNYDFSVKIGQYGVIELNMLRKDESSNKYISSKIETTTQRPQSEQKAINKFMDKDKYNKYIHDDIKEFEEIKETEGENKEVNIRDVVDEKEEKHVKEELDKADEREKTPEDSIRKYLYD